MNPAESFKDKTFVVTDPDARVRHDDDMMAFALTAGGQFRTIPQGSEVKVLEIRIAQAGSQRNLIFGRAAAVGHDEVLSWTSTRNLDAKFMNETIGLVRPEPGASRFGPNAAWSNGEFLGQGIASQSLTQGMRDYHANMAASWRFTT